MRTGLLPVRGRGSGSRRGSDDLLSAYFRAESVISPSFIYPIAPKVDEYDEREMSERVE